MSGRLTFVTLPVADLDASCAFYQAVFRWQPSRRLVAAIFFDLSTLTLALMERRAFSRFLGLPGELSQPSATLCSWNVVSAADVDELVQRARQPGAVVRREPAALDWGGYAGIIETPDGHLWEIVWNPRHTNPPPENNL